MKRFIFELRYWYWYWYVTRNVRKLIPWLARKLPRSLKYYVVIHGMCKVESNTDPSGVTGLQLLNLWEDPKTKKSRKQRIDH